MNAPLYTIDILRLATSNPHQERLTSPMGMARRRSVSCGSEVTVDINVADGRVTAIGMLVEACAFGQASSTLLAAHAIGRTPGDLAAARDSLARWLADEGSQPDWPDIDLLVPARRATGRHPAILLAFDAAADAAAQAEASA